ncbi:hypothetical protein HMPREF1624_06714 [Sporothrix schenckii ATCC 58251]|uniref:Kinetochore protein fta4 n=1 Tax=Sporothrix schenckii (strain ATCC 58251 / de Perez 2211183) TaxID=1391915 RepID=U7PP93_SPOS1|nr:hypothetical protein HMPREF1624_06714 [Sporothrix schenckii ATCC 58251]
MDPPTVIAIKRAFLELATRQLAQPLTPSRTWQRRNNSRGTIRGRDAVAIENSTGDIGDGGRRLPPKVIDEVLVRTNQLLLLHSRRVHTSTAVRHVAEQLDQLYQATSDDLLALPNDAGSESLDRGLDYTWDDSLEADRLPLEARRYTEQVIQLQALARHRTEAAARVRRLRGINSLLDGVSSDVVPAQLSLVTRDGPVEGELGRMRLLLARVAKKQAIASGSNGAPKRFTRVTKAPRSAKAVKAHASTGKVMKKFSSGLAAKTEAMLGDRAGHLELIGPGKKKGVDRKSDKAHQAGSRRFG